MASKPRKQVRKTVPAGDPKTVTWKGKRHSVDALATEWLKRLEAEFKQYQSTRNRDAVYRYLEAVYTFAFSFGSIQECKRVASRMARKKGRFVRPKQRRFSLLISASAAVEEGTRWKWSTCLRFAQSKKIQPVDLKQFVKGFGGINDCADEGVIAYKRRG